MKKGAKKSRRQVKLERLRKQGIKRRRKTFKTSPSAAFSGLKAILQKYDQKELLATLGGLQLAPENHTHTLRLEVATRIACSMETTGHARVNVVKLYSELNDCLPSNGMVGILEDPVESLFTENIIFNGGNYVVYSGIVGSGSFILNSFLKAIFQVGEGLSREFKAEVDLATMALLSLSDAVADRLGHVRNMVSPNTWRDAIHAPNKKEANRFRDAVLFSKDALADFFKRKGLSPECLSPFFTSLGDPSLRAENPDSNPLCGKPLVRIGNTIILVQPASITSALRHFFLVTAKRMGLIQALATNYRRTIHMNVEKCLSRMFFQPVSVDFPDWDAAPQTEESLYRIDTNKLAYVQMIVDDAADYAENEVFGSWATKDIAGEMEIRRKTIVKWLLRQDDLDCSAIFLIIILEGIGRFSVLGVDKQPAQTRTVLMFAEELETVSNLRECDSLTLWKYAGARERMLDVFPKYFGISSFLDVYALYLNHHHSFYLSDDGRLIPLVPPGYGHELRVKAANVSDIHAVLFKPAGAPSRYVTVTRRYEGDPIPIYVLYDSLSPFARVVEGCQQPLWAMREHLPEYGSEALNDTYFKVTDLVAYWLWQVTSSLKPHLEPLGQTPINVRIRLDKPDKWADILTTIDASSVEDFGFEVDGFEIIFSIPDGIQKQLGCVDNEADRLVLDQLLRAFDAILLRHGKTPSLTAEVRQEILDLIQA